ncbi:MAG: 2-oxoacid:ferredoxin oxidoreductase subunit beta [Cyclobacteriaceae bacterium]|nr:2-oxoacid:ferredoxin oxidoreductase subunit beta [Cyclobacteriaceae bacterium]
MKVTQEIQTSTKIKSNGSALVDQPLLSPKSFESGQEVRWCPGCGDYSILKQMQQILPDLGLKKEDIVFISGIGCSSRFPYYLDTFGMHSIHGRAPAIASGLKATRPELSIWIITGDGDGLSIGGNHMAHVLRRNFDLNILFFNNEIYGLTKGQYSPTSAENSITKSTPYGSLDHPFNPLAFALGADGSFVARSMDRDPKHLQALLKIAHSHKGTSFLEIYQNCNIFNNGAFFVFTEKDSKPVHTIFLEHGAPLVYGVNKEKGIILDGYTPRIVELGENGISTNDLWIHDETDRTKSHILSRFFEDPRVEGNFPRPFGVFYREERSLFEQRIWQQLETVKQKKGLGDLDALIAGNETWVIKE